MRRGAITTIDYPGAVYTDARGINNHGEIVGAYRMPGEPAVNFHGYRRSRYGEFIPIDFPGHTNTMPQRITYAGLVLGCRHDGDTMGTMHGIEINSHNTSEATEIGLFASMTEARFEIEFQGSRDGGKTWIVYPFRYKPQDVNERPGIYAPYQPRFDWNLWFASNRRVDSTAVPNGDPPFGSSYVPRRRTVTFFPEENCISTRDPSPR